MLFMIVFGIFFMVFVFSCVSCYSVEFRGRGWDIFFSSFRRVRGEVV